jgi:inorganic pyrophosphatase
MSLQQVPAGRDLPNDINVIIEVPMNSPAIKYAVACYESRPVKPAF